MSQVIIACISLEDCISVADSFNIRRFTNCLFPLCFYFIGNGMTDNTNDDADFRGKSIIFIGDSHIRGLADLFMHVVCQYQLETKEIIDPLDMTSVQRYANI